MKKLLLAAAFVACVYGANWAIDTFDPIEFPILGWAAPAGVLFAGFTFGVRDALHDAGGHRWVLPAVTVGAALSWYLTDAVTLPGGHVSLAAASGIAFAASELADWLIYTPLRRNHWAAGVFVSNLVGAVVDSLLFLWLAFGAVDLVGGQVMWKLAMVAPALPIVWQTRETAVAPA